MIIEAIPMIDRTMRAYMALEANFLEESSKCIDSTMKAQYEHEIDECEKMICICKSQLKAAQYESSN